MLSISIRSLAPSIQWLRQIPLIVYSPGSDLESEISFSAPPENVGEMSLFSRVAMPRLTMPIEAQSQIVGRLWEVAEEAARLIRRMHRYLVVLVEERDCSTASL